MMFLIFGFGWVGLAIAFQLTGYDAGYWPALVIANLWFAASLLRHALPTSEEAGA